MTNSNTPGSYVKRIGLGSNQFLQHEIFVTGI
jgi:hypothetical protein